MDERNFLVCRIYTHKQLREYSAAAAALVRFALQKVCTEGNLFLLENPFIGRGEVSIDRQGLEEFIGRIEQGLVESFVCFLREPDQILAFPFLLRVESEQPNSLYSKWELYYKYKDVYPPMSYEGYRIELFFDISRFGQAFYEQQSALLDMVSSLFIDADGVYGYLSKETPEVAFQGVSALERSLVMRDIVWRGSWVDSYEHRVAGLFWCNLLGEKLAAKVNIEDIQRIGWTVERVGSGVMISKKHEPLGRSSIGPDDEISRCLGDLMPSTTLIPMPLPEHQTTSYLLSTEHVMKLGGLPFIRRFFPVDQCLEVSKGRVILSKTKKDNTDRIVLAEYFWPIRPAVSEYWRFRLPQGDKRLDVVRPYSANIATIEMCVAVEDLGKVDRLRYLVRGEKRMGKAPREACAQTIATWAESLAGKATVEGSNDKAVWGTVTIGRIDPEAALDLAEQIDSLVRPASRFLFALGDLVPGDTGLVGWCGGSGI